MRRIKKRELRKYHFDRTQNNEPEEQLDELVDGDGSPIEGDRNPVSNSEIEVAPGQTTDDYAQSAIQPSNQFNGLYGTPYSRGQRAIALESERKAKEILKRILKENNK